MVGNSSRDPDAHRGDLLSFSDPHTRVLRHTKSTHPEVVESSNDSLLKPVDVSPNGQFPDSEPHDRVADELPRTVKRRRSTPFDPKDRNTSCGEVLRGKNEIRFTASRAKRDSGWVFKDDEYVRSTVTDALTDRSTLEVERLPVVRARQVQYEHSPEVLCLWFGPRYETAAAEIRTHVFFGVRGSREVRRIRLFQAPSRGPFPRRCRAWRDRVSRRPVSASRKAASSRCACPKRRLGGQVQLRRR